MSDVVELALTGLLMMMMMMLVGRAVGDRTADIRDLQHGLWPLATPPALAPSSATARSHRYGRAT